EMEVDDIASQVIREEASSLARMDLSSLQRPERGIPPVSLALFLFNSLLIKDNLLLREEDENVGVGASLFVLGARHPYPETIFPMLGECLRRQKGDLALRLMKKYKDDSHKLGLVLDRLLDASQHRMYKYHKSNGVYFLERDPILGPVIERGEKPTMAASLSYLLKKKEEGREDGNGGEEERERERE
ncbi:hypothetical protein PMAYCL1PPCAC_18117, partial [Pristionchus mayeri]